MNTKATLDTLKKQATLSTLWLVTLLNIIFQNIHELVHPGFPEEIMTRTLNGDEISPALLLLSSVMIEIPIMMVLLARVLPQWSNRLANLIAAPIMMAFVLMGQPTDLLDYFYATIELVLLVFVVGIARRWQSENYLAPYTKASMETA